METADGRLPRDGTGAKIDTRHLSGLGHGEDRPPVHHRAAGDIAKRRKGVEARGTGYDRLPLHPPGCGVEGNDLAG